MIKAAKPKIEKLKNDKGLSDEELIKKYESGKVEMKNLVRNMLSKPNPKIENPKKV